MIWIAEHADGTQSQHLAEPGTNFIPAGERHAIVPRELDLLVEKWDFVTNEIVPISGGHAARCDQEHKADYGAESIKRAHIQKAVEAQLILAGITLPNSLVAAEATELAMDINDLSELILQRAQEDYAIELARRAAKASQP